MKFYRDRARQGEIWKDGANRPSTKWFP